MTFNDLEPGDWFSFTDGSKKIYITTKGKLGV